MFLLESLDTLSMLLLLLLSLGVGTEGCGTTLGVVLVLLEGGLEGSVLVPIVRVSSPALLGPGVVVSGVNSPAVVHHEFEVLVVVNAGTDEVVVILELLFSDHPVSNVAQVGVLFEGVHELP